MSAGRLALFDLDGTITRRDTFAPWVLGLLRRHPGRWWRAPALLLHLLLYALRIHDRGSLKGAVMHTLFAGMHRETVAAWSREFAHLAATELAFPEALEAIRTHRADGEELILLSASPDTYVPLIGEALGFSRTICSEVRWKDDLLDGRLIGANRRGPEKSRVLEALRAERPGRRVIGYGNSPPDLDHLLRCEEAVYVNAGPGLRRRLVLPKLRYVHWR